MSMVLRQITTESEGDKQDFDFPTTATQGLIVDADERVDGEQQHLHVSYDHKIGAWAHHAALTQSQNSTDYLVNGNATSGLRENGYYSICRPLDGSTAAMLNDLSTWVCRASREFGKYLRWL